MPKTNKPSLSARPPQSPAQEDLVNQFIQAAEVTPATPKKTVTKPATPMVAKTEKTTYPWEDPTIREDVRKLFSLRFPEPVILKLKFISEQTGKNMHQICMDVIEPMIDAEIKRLTK